MDYCTQVRRGSGGQVTTPSGVRGGRSGALKNVQGHVVSRDTWCPRRAVRERRRPSQDSWPSWDSTVLGQRKCPGTKRGVLGQPTPSQDGDCPGHRVSRDTFASRTPFASQDIPPDPQMVSPRDSLTLCEIQATSLHSPHDGGGPESRRFAPSLRDLVSRVRAVR